MRKLFLLFVALALTACASPEYAQYTAAQSSIATARAQAAALRANQADLAAATFVDLQHADTRAGAQMLEAAGLLAAGRALEILDAEITPEERPL